MCEFKTRIKKIYMKNLLKIILKKIIPSSYFFSIVNICTPIVTNANGIKFYGLFPIPYNRGKTLLTKEPDMIAFIDDHVNEGDIYYDIGANIGVFSMYSSIKKKGTVFAFEPESSNYFILNKNISLNNLTGKVVAYNIAINDIDEVSFLNLKEDIVPGKSGNTFKNEINEENNSFTPGYRQGVFGISLDSFVYKYGQPCPNHLKIDVDGNEYKIINGMKRVLTDLNLKTIAIEVNTRIARDMNLIKIIESNDFIKSDEYKNQVYEQNGIVNYFFIRFVK
jgi:FkbM family methyltransferase